MRALRRLLLSLGFLITIWCASATPLTSCPKWPHCPTKPTWQEKLKAKVSLDSGVTQPVRRDPVAVYDDLLVGQPYVKEALAGWLSAVQYSCADARPKAFLFAGNRGAGKTRSALMVAEAKNGLLRFCRPENGDRFSYGRAHECLERNGLLMMSLDQWRDEDTAQRKFRALMGEDTYGRVMRNPVTGSRRCPTLILDDIQATADAHKLLAKFKSCIDLNGLFYLNDGTSISCSGLTLVLTGQIDCMWNKDTQQCDDNPRMHYGRNTDADVRYVAETLSRTHNSLNLSAAVSRAQLEPFLTRWLGDNLAPFVTVVPFYAASHEELHRIALKQAEEYFHCALCDVCGDITFVLDKYVHDAIAAKPSASGRDISIPIQRADTEVLRLRHRCEQGHRLSAIEFQFMGFAAAAKVFAV